MKRWPKYKTLPLALLIYCIAMGVYGVMHNDGKLPDDDFFLICAIEVAIIVALFFLLRYQYNKRK